MAQRAIGSALPAMTQTLPESPLTLFTSVPLSPCDGFLAHTMTKPLLSMPVSSTFGTEPPSVRSTVVPYALTASGALSHHLTHHTPESAHPLESVTSYFRDSAGSGFEILHGMDEDSLNQTSTTRIPPLDSVQYHSRGTIQEANSQLTADWLDHSVAKGTSGSKEFAVSLEECNELDDSQSVLSELSFEDRSLSPHRNQPTLYFDLVGHKNKKYSKKIAPWRVLKPIVLKPFIALAPQDI